ncbi:hypothetical protein Pfo_003550, partial [Paulownia fortunei]
DYFDSLQLKRAGTLSLGSGSTCKIMGFEVVKIKMIDGVNRTLGGVAYIPKMRRNIIFLSQLDSRSCEYSADGGVLKVIRNGRVLMIEEKYENLYSLVTSKDD